MLGPGPMRQRLERARVRARVRECARTVAHPQRAGPESNARRPRASRRAERLQLGWLGRQLHTLGRPRGMPAPTRKSHRTLGRSPPSRRGLKRCGLKRSEPGRHGHPSGLPRLHAALRQHELLEVRELPGLARARVRSSGSPRGARLPERLAGAAMGQL